MIDAARNMSAAATLAPTPPGLRAGRGPGGVFPVPRKRLIIVSLGPVSEVAASIVRMAQRLEWPTLTVTELDKVTWATSVNKPALVVVAGNGQLQENMAVIEAVRNTGKCPVVVIDDLSSQGVMKTLVAGADTVIGTEIREDELAARLLALMRRSAAGSDSGARYLTAGELHVDLWARETHSSGKPLGLSSTEFRLLVCLMEQAGQTVPTNRILYRVWGWGGEEGLNALRIYMTRLRHKLGESGKESSFIRSVRGQGYLFVPRVIEHGDRETLPSAHGGVEIMQRLVGKCEVLNNAPDIATAAENIVEALVSEGTVDAVGLHLTEGSSLKLIAHRGFSAAWEDAARDLLLMDSRFASIQAVTTAEPIQVLRLQGKGYPGTSVACSEEGPGTYLFVPIKNAGTVIGTMGILRHSLEPYGPMTMSYLQAVAALCGTSLGVRSRARQRSDSAPTTVPNEKSQPGDEFSDVGT